MKIEYGEVGWRLPREFDLPHIRLVGGRGTILSEVCDVDYENSVINGIALPYPDIKKTGSRRTGGIFMGAGSVGEDLKCCSLFCRGTPDIRAFHIHLCEEGGLPVRIRRALQLIVDSSEYNGWTLQKNPKSGFLPVSICDRDYIKSLETKGTILFHPVRL